MTPISERPSNEKKGLVNTPEKKAVELPVGKDRVHVDHVGAVGHRQCEALRQADEAHLRVAPGMV